MNPAPSVDSTEEHLPMPGKNPLDATLRHESADANVDRMNSSMATSGSVAAPSEPVEGRPGKRSDANLEKPEGTHPSTSQNVEQQQKENLPNWANVSGRNYGPPPLRRSSRIEGLRATAAAVNAAATANTAAASTAAAAATAVELIARGGDTKPAPRAAERHEGKLRPPLMAVKKRKKPPDAPTVNPLDSSFKQSPSSLPVPFQEHLECRRFLFAEDDHLDVPPPICPNDLGEYFVRVPTKTAVGPHFAFETPMSDLTSPAPFGIPSSTDPPPPRRPRRACDNISEVTTTLAIMPPDELDSPELSLRCVAVKPSPPPEPQVLTRAPNVTEGGGLKAAPRAAAIPMQKEKTTTTTTTTTTKIGPPNPSAGIPPAVAPARTTRGRPPERQQQPMTTRGGGGTRRPPQRRRPRGLNQLGTDFYMPLPTKPLALKKPPPPPPPPPTATHAVATAAASASPRPDPPAPGRARVRWLMNDVDTGVDGPRSLAAAAPGFDNVASSRPIAHGGGGNDDDSDQDQKPRARRTNREKKNKHE